MHPVPRPVVTNPLRTYPVRVERRTRAVNLSSTLRDLIVQRVNAPVAHHFGMSVVVDRTTNSLFDVVFENRAERVEIFRTVFVDSATGVKTAMNMTDLATMQEVISPDTMVPCPRFHSTSEISCDLSMISIISHAAMHILQPTWPDQYNGMRAHLTQLSTLIAVLAEDIEKNSNDCANLRNQSIDFATRGLHKTFMTDSIFMKPWFDGRAGWQAILVSLDTALNPMYEDHTKAKMPAGQIAPWNLCMVILNGHFAISFAYIMAMTCLFDAWCPHNYNMVYWMNAHHIADHFDNTTIERQIRVASLFFWLINCNDLSRFPDVMHADLVRIRVKLVHIVTTKHYESNEPKSPPTPVDPEYAMYVKPDEPEIKGVNEALDETFPGWRIDHTGPIMAAASRITQTEPAMLLRPTVDALPPCDDQLHTSISPFGLGNDAIAFSYYPRNQDGRDDLFCDEVLNADYDK